jgi:DNA-binding winged helix-turn-helix (wHTH) protein/tetratricopeptide (TPR) repeat protein
MVSVARFPSLRRFGPFVLDDSSGELRKSGILLKIAPQPFRVLLLLVEHPGKIVTREEIEHCLWNGNTLVDSDGGINFCVKQIRAVLADDVEKPKYIETLPRRGYRFIAPVSQDGADDQVIEFPRGVAQPPNHPRPIADAEGAVSPVSPVPVPLQRATATAGARRRNAYGVVAAGTVAACLLAAFGISRSGSLLHRGAKLGEKDTLVLADFDNKTGDSVFDGALKQALVAGLGQSPFLNLLPERKISETLRMMGKPSSERVAGEVGREVCLRTGSKALLTGTISMLDTHYLLSLNAVACASGEVLASEQAVASRKEDVLKVLSRSAASMRTRLGESLPSVQKYDVPIEATTNSLEALQSLSMAARFNGSEGDAATIPFVERALEYDPNFASAYAALARRYNNLNQPALALENATRAYELRDRVTEREWLQISATYFRSTGDLESHNKILELWKANYPRDSGPHGRYCINYELIGLYEKSLPECEESVRLDPDYAVSYANLAAVLLELNRTDDAQRVCGQAAARNLPCSERYDIAFLRGDSAGMERELSEAAGKAGVEDAILSDRANTEAYYGRLRKAREFSRKAAESAMRDGLKEAASLWRANAALREAEFGETQEARRNVDEALKVAPSRDVKVLSAVALVRIGETSRAKELAKELEQNEPSNTLLKVYWLPVIEAGLALKQDRLGNALATLQAMSAYELAHPTPQEIGTLYPVFLRGQTYLAERDGTAAAREFQKMLEHPGISVNFPTAALAHLGVARAYSLQGDTSSARAAYEEFLALWKDADPDVPILNQAKAEYQELRGTARVLSKKTNPWQAPTASSTRR